MADSQPTSCADAQQVNETPVEYRDIPGFPGYRAGSDGSIWSCHALGPGGSMKGAWRKKSASVSHSGYLYVHMRLNGRGTNKYVHRLVLESFVGPCPEGMEACHNDGDKTDNCLVNLRWDTKKSNGMDKVSHGTSATGSRNGQAKLTEAQVLEIRRLLDDGISRRKVEELFGVGEGTVARIARRQSWKCI